MKTDGKSVIYALIAVMSWSTVATAFKIALSHLTHYEMLLISGLTSLIIFVLLITMQGKWRLVLNLNRKQWTYYACLGLLNPLAYYLVLFKAYDLLPAQIAQPINYAWPIVLLIMLAVFCNKPIPANKYLGMFVSLAGVAVISLGGGMGNMQFSITGLLLAALSAVLWATYWMANNMVKIETDSSVSLFATFLFGCIYLLAGTIFIDLHSISMEGLFAGMYVGAFEMGIPFIFFGLAIKSTSNPALINQLCYLSPFLSLFFIAVVLGEPISLSTYIGLAMIVSGLVYNQYFTK